MLRILGATPRTGPETIAVAAAEAAQTLPVSRTQLERTSSKVSVVGVETIIPRRRSYCGAWTARASEH